MPYKRKEDRTEAVRRHRKKKAIEEGLITINDAETLGEALKDFLHFETAPFEDFVEWCQENLIVGEDGVRDKTTGQLLHPPQVVYFRPEMIVVVPKGA